MILFFEGIDRCGKDSIIQKIKKDFKDKRIIEIKNGPNETLESYQFQLDLAAIYESNDIIFIFNRSIIGEYVYSYLYRNVSVFHIENVRKVVNNIKPYNSILFMFLPKNIDNVIKNDDGESLFQNKNDIENEIIRFNVIFDYIKFKKYKILSYSDSIENLYQNQIKNVILKEFKND